MTDLKIDVTFREIIPALTAEEYAILESSIIFEGCRDPIVVWNGLIIDGHNRYDICKKNNIPFEIDERTFSTKKDALSWMINNQLGRRNLTDAQKVELVLKRDEILGSQSRGNIAPGMEFTHQKREEIAQETGVSERNVSKVKKVLDDGDKRTKKDMKDGKISINKAYEKTTGKFANKPKPKVNDVKVSVKSGDYNAPSTWKDGNAPEKWLEDDEMPCTKCKGTGKQKKILTIVESDCITCGECGRKHYTNLDTIIACKSCGHHWKSQGE